MKVKLCPGLKKTNQPGSGTTWKEAEMLKFSKKEEGKRNKETERRGKEGKGGRKGKERKGKERKGKKGKER